MSEPTQKSARGRPSTRLTLPTTRSARPANAGDILRRLERDASSVRAEEVLLLQRLVGNQAVVQRGRPSREERNSAREAKSKEQSTKSLYDRADKKKRTRRATNLAKALEGKDEQEVLAKAIESARKNTPPTEMEVSGLALFSGNRDFGTDFRQNFWTNVSPLPCACAICGGTITAGAKRGNGPSIDHRRPWSEISTGVETFQVCKDGVHWEVSLDRDAQAVNRNLANLRPTHKGCNSGKGGQKGNDPLIPTRKGDCRGNCGLSKAS